MKDLLRRYAGGQRGRPKRAILTDAREYCQVGDESKDKDSRLIAAWPREARLDRRRFELLKRAYGEARYLDSYEIGADNLTAIVSSVQALRDVVEQGSLERLDELRRKARL